MPERLSITDDALAVERLADRGRGQRRRRLVERAPHGAARGVLVAAAAEAMRDAVDGHLALAAEAHLDDRPSAFLAEEHRDLDAAIERG